jgi:hypothetical protein
MWVYTTMSVPGWMYLIHTIGIFQPYSTATGHKVVVGLEAHLAVISRATVIHTPITPLVAKDGTVVLFVYFIIVIHAHLNINQV